MATPKLTKLEMQVMDALWSRGPASVREIQESFPAKDRPAYTTVQTLVYRLEAQEGDSSRQEDRKRAHFRSRRQPRRRAASGSSTSS